LTFAVKVLALAFAGNVCLTKLQHVFIDRRKLPFQMTQMTDDSNNMVA